ncbi:MAG: Smr/MutS family protein [Deltaproteobacteria bacterium]|nr:Smr/MutS family protein [Deltaproteobacteria bacterium]
MLVLPRTLVDLGWPALKHALAVRTTTARGRERATALAFLADADAVTASFAAVAECRTLSRLGLVLPLSGIGDPTDALDRAQKGALLPPEEIRACSEVIRAAAATRAFVSARRDACPVLWRHAALLVELGALANRIDAAFEPSGRLKDTASAALGSYRERARQLHAQIKDKVEGLIHDPDFSLYLQDTYYSVRSDRYVLPILAACRNRVPGIVHNASQSGATLFIEPQQLVESGNELAIAESLALEEERQILTEFSAYLGDHAAALQLAVRLLAELDLSQAKARLADALDAETPTLTAADAGLAIKAGRHPLLVLQQKSVQPNDVVLGTGQQVLVVSGPNAGGKTVAITMVGLMALMVQAGLPIPAASGSRLPLYAAIQSAIGDAQDLARDLSTFSAHLTTLAEILRQVGPAVLVVVDEIAADTDPKEGAALAAAVLETAADAGAHVLVTTHLDEVKALALVDPRFANARMTFDKATLRPTYSLELGAAGVSNALAIAAQVGLPDAVVTNARARLDQGGALSLALARLDAETGAANRERRALEDERQALEAATAKVAAAQRALAEERAALELEVRAEVTAELEQARAEAAQLIASLQAAPSMAAAQRAQRAIGLRVDALQRDNERRKARLEVAAGARGAAAKIEVGVRVRVVSLKEEGEVLAVDPTHAVVALGSLRTRIALADLVAVGAKGGAKVGPPRRQGGEAQAAPRPELETLRCDVRGLRADEALRAIELFLDKAAIAGETVVTITHGHGTGALKRAVREELLRSPYVAAARPGERHEGGDGVTVVELRG